MNSKKIVRVVLDMALTVMIAVEMFIQFTGVFLHEIIGFAFFATVVLHLVLSSKWIKNTADSAKKGTMTARRTALVVMGFLLTINMIVLGMSSIAISTVLSSAGFVWPLGSQATWAIVHSVSSYVLCALVVVHLGMHWTFLASAFRVSYDPSRRQAINTGVHAVAAMGALALGATAVRQAVPLAIANESSAGAGAGEMRDERFEMVDDVLMDSDGASSGTGDSKSGYGSSGSSAEARDALDAADSSAGSSDGSSSDSDAPRKGKHKGKKKGKHSKSSGDTEFSKISDQGSASSRSADGGFGDSGSEYRQDSKSEYASGADAESDYDSDAGTESDYDSESSTESYPDYSYNDGSSAALGTCTLCHKRCSLSAPQCDRPYQAGLL